MPYEVHTPVFDGPFDLLLHLILREQVDLYEVNLSEIVDAYLVELERMEHLDLEVATEFLLIAATLVELKARRLLPEDSEIEVSHMKNAELRVIESPFGHCVASPGVHQDFTDALDAAARDLLDGR